MTYLLKKNIQKNMAAFMLTLMLTETLLPGYALTRASWSGSFFADYRYQHIVTQPVFASPQAALSPLPAARATVKQKDDIAGQINARQPLKTFIGGPGQPEMSSFKSVNADNMVDLFTGDFSYGIPLLDVGGYPVSIHYNGGATIDQEASWVGIGWNINPGTVGRSLRGLPDDFNGDDTISRIQKIRDNKTVGVNVAGNVEIFGGSIGLGVNAGVFKNTYNGWGIEHGINANISAGSASKGSLTASLGLQNNSQTGINVTPGLSFMLADQNSGLEGKGTLSTNYNSRSGLSGLQLGVQVSGSSTFIASAKVNGGTISDVGHVNWSNGHTSFISFATPAYTPTIQMPFTSTNYTFATKIGGELWGVHGNVSVSGYVSNQGIEKEDTLQSLRGYGFLYYTNAKNDAKALLDMNREKEIYFNYASTPHIAIPQYTYDVYSISGEGTGGMFRPYRSEAGFVRDHHMQTKSNTGNFAINLGGGAYFKAGADVNVTVATTRNDAWKSEVTPNLDFREADTTFQPVYFRNPGEKTNNSAAYYNAIGGDSTVRIALSGSGNNVSAANILKVYSGAQSVKDINIGSPLAKRQRDKRTQVISYKTASEASQNGLDRIIRSYKENSIPLAACPDTALDAPLPRVDDIHRPHHISEITVLNSDGRRYIYGLPAYSVEQSDVTFAISKETNQPDIDRGIASYIAEKDNHAGTNQSGKDHFFTKDVMPPYAHSFLLTGLVSPDYVDITGDGITDDDLGDAVKFNYTMIYGKGKQYYKWRTPNEANKANYNDGLKTYNRDDKGTYMYGKKEVWYLNSIASKTMIAVFRISNKREDNLGITGENGGVDAGQRMRRLDRIDLYSKPDLIKNGASARPVKSVHFEYDYSQCRNTVNNSGNPVDKNGNTVAEESSSNVNKNKGKLTLRKIWFSYNGNYKGVKNPYTFNYSQVEPGQPENKYNPEHNSKQYDRWGTYKDPADNPAGLNNVDYPYAIQDSAKSATYANAWQLTDIKLPSGGVMKISYEADDYAYVQDRRACQLFKVAGFGSSATSTPGNMLYESSLGNEDLDYVFIDVNEPVTDKDDIYRKYLEGINKIFCKIAVKMPSDVWGSGYEWVPTYFEIEAGNYGVVTGNNTRIWMKLAHVDSKQPLTLAALQFLRLNLPSKAYPGSETEDNLNFESAVTMLLSSLPEMQDMLNGFYAAAKSRFLCQQVNVESSFVRLNTPLYKKYGGGYRVKRVEVFDNWHAMTGQKEASYGQNYFYTTTKVINKSIIQSGVRKLVKDTITISSGVASYEPFIGGEENPLKEPIEYQERMAVLAPKNYMYSEKPLGESFYPAAMVGYSKVTVRTINTKARSANGWQETEFYTTKDFPTIVDFTPLSGDSKKRYNPTLRNLLRLNAISNITLSQGFKVELNDMNGKIKSQTSYAENDSLNPLQYTRNFYKVDNDSVTTQHLNNKVWIVDSLNGSINKDGIIGLDIELMNDMREQYSRTNSQNHQGNLDLIPILWFSVPIITYYPMIQREQNTFRSVATVKIVQRYGILDSVVVMDKGSIVSTKNLVYDGETGDPVVTRTNNEFDDPVYQFNYPAYWAYGGMGAAYKNINAVFRNKTVIKGKMYSGTKSSFNAERFFESGDEIWVDTCSLTESATAVPGDCPQYMFSGLTTNIKLWAIDAAKGKEKDEGIYFIDENGKPFHGYISSMHVIRSGRRNMLSASAGNIVSLINPVREISAGRFKIVIDSNINVINTAATAYKDLWQVEKSYYIKDSVIRVYRDFDPISVNPTRVTKLLYDINGSGTLRDKGFYSSSKYVGASFDFLNSSTCRPSRSIYTKSILEFSLEEIPKDAIIDSAFISFSERIPRDYLSRVTEPRDCGFSINKDSYDWKSSTNYHLNNSAVWLKKITGTFNLNTSYFSLQTTDNNRVSIDYNNSRMVRCTSLIQDFVSDEYDKRFGFVFELKNFARPGSGNSETSYLTFCGNDEYDANRLAGIDCGLSHPGDPNPKISCDCSSPFLIIFYKAYVDSIAHLCKENINDTATNPYRWGILGNWRADRAYTWYSDRKENNADITDTDIRREGVLKQFTSFWSFSDSGLVNTADTTKWVWNAASSIYNRRGFEVENYDPLGRYNAGLYGFAQSLPVAVAQNSRYRELLYDGFEDYNYRNEACVPFCDIPREFDFVKDQSGVTIDSLQHHTGKHSIKITAGAESLLQATVSGPDSLAPAISAKVDSVPVYTTKVIGLGTGIDGIFTQSAFDLFFSDCASGMGGTATSTGTELNFSWGFTTPFSNICGRTSYRATWEGQIQAPATGWYTFYLDMQGGTGQLSINGVPVADGGNGSRPILLIGGAVLYEFVVEYRHSRFQPAGIKLSWSSSALNIPPGTRQTIPLNYLYPLTTPGTPLGSIQTSIATYCIDLNNIKQERIIRPTFSPVQGKKIVVSAWMKLDGEDCNTAPALENTLRVGFNGSVTDTLVKTGMRIEGWQRYEKAISIPSNATSVFLSLKGSATKTVYIDDVRIQPFNSSMKSFAYDPVSLRLMAELDENNYASFYEYDNDGTLIRVKKETVKGIQTIKETRSAIIREE
jgi:hypothetical protein